MARSRMPNFLLIGAAKSGTTSLFNYLGQHPDIYVSAIKEPGFFAFTKNDIPITKEEREFIALHWGNFPNAKETLEDYRALFARAGNAKAVGEASTVYWTSSLAPRCIKHHIPDARLIAILRDPAERAYSAYRMNRRSGRDVPETFDEALSRTDFLDPSDTFEPAENSGYRHFLAHGHYFKWLKSYLDVFARENIRVHLFDDLVEDPLSVVRDTFSFLDVDPTFTPDIGVRHNADYLESANNPAIRAFEALVPQRVRTAARALTPPALRYRYDRIHGSPPPCPPGARKRLIAYYRDDMLRLQDLIGQDLRSWFAVPTDEGDG